MVSVVRVLRRERIVGSSMSGCAAGGSVFEGDMVVVVVGMGCFQKDCWSKIR